MTNLQLSAKQIRDVAKTASVDARTLLRYLCGERVRLLAAERIRAALAAAGLLALLLVLGCSDYVGPPPVPTTDGAGGEVGSDAGSAVEPDTLPAMEPDSLPAISPDARPDTAKPDTKVLVDTLPAVEADTLPAMPGACAVPKVILDSVGGGICAKYWTGTKIGCKVGCQDFETATRMTEPTPCLTVGKDAYRTRDAWTGPVVCLWSWDDCDRYCTTPIN